MNDITILINGRREALIAALKLQRRTYKTFDDEIKAGYDNRLLILASVEELNDFPRLKNLAENRPSPHVIIIDGDVNQLTWTPSLFSDKSKEGYLILGELDLWCGEPS